MSDERHCGHGTPTIACHQCRERVEQCEHAWEADGPDAKTCSKCGVRQFENAEAFLASLDAIESEAIARQVAKRDATRGEESVDLDDAMRQLGFDPEEPQR